MKNLKFEGTTDLATTVEMTNSGFVERKRCEEVCFFYYVKLSNLFVIAKMVKEK